MKSNAFCFVRAVVMSVKLHTARYYACSVTRLRDIGKATYYFEHYR